MSDLSLYYTNDMHGRFAALDHLASLPRTPSTLLLDGGDALEGSNTLCRRSEPVLERMSELGYAAMTMGNRELHYLRAVMRWRRDQRSFPLLASNLTDLRHRGHHNLWDRSLELEVGGLRVGLFGATVVQYPHHSLWERLFGLRFFAPEKCLPAIAEELRSRCDLVFFMSHLGFDIDRQLAACLPGVDLILGAHSHHVLSEIHLEQNVPIVQTGSHSRYLAELKLWLGKPNRLEYRLMQPALVA